MAETHNEGKCEEHDFNLHDLSSLLKALDVQDTFPADIRDSKCWSALAYSLLHLKRYKYAESNFSILLKENESDAALWNGRGLSLFRQKRGGQKRYDEAVRDFSKALELDKHVAKYWNDRGMVYFELGRYEDALSDYTAAADLPIARDEECEYRTRKARSLMELKRYEEAIIELDKAILLDWQQKRIAPLRTYLGHCYFELKKYSEAEDYYGMCVGLGSDALSWYRRGICKQERGCGSYQEFAKAIRLGIQVADCYIQCGDYLMKQGNITSAVEDYRSANALEGTNAEYRYKYSQCLFQSGSFEKAVSECAKAINLNENEPKYWYHRGVCYKEMKQFEEAVKDFTEAIRLDGTASSYWHERGKCLKEMGKDEAAEEDLKKCPELVQYVKEEEEAEQALVGAFSDQSTFVVSTDFSASSSSSFASSSKANPFETSKGPTPNLFSSGGFDSSTTKPTHSDPVLHSFSFPAAPSGDGASSFDSSTQGGFHRTQDNTSSPHTSKDPLSKVSNSTLVEEKQATCPASTNIPTSSTTTTSRPKSKKVLIRRRKKKKDVTPHPQPTSSSHSSLPSPPEGQTSSKQEPDSATISSAPTLASPYASPEVQHHVESTVGVVELWEQEMLRKNNFNLNEGYTRIGFKQDTISRMMLWFSLVVEESEHFVPDANRLTSIISMISQGCNLDTKDLENLSCIEFGEACCIAASKQQSFSHMLICLEHGKICSPPHGGIKCGVLAAILRYHMLGESHYKALECLLYIRYVKLLSDRKRLPDDLDYKVEGLYLYDAGVLNSFIVQTLLRGSLKNNNSTALYRSFFRSGLREVHLLPVIAGYLDEKKKSKSVITLGKGDLIMNVRSVSNLMSFLFLLLENDSNICKSILTLTIERQNSNIMLPVLFHMYSNLNSVNFDSFRSSSMDFSSLSKVDTSKITSISLNGPFRFPCLSSLSQCNLSQLGRLFVNGKGLKSFDGLTKNNTCSLKTFSVNCEDLVDISALSKCNFPCLDFFSINACSTVADVSLSPFAESPLESFSYTRGRGLKSLDGLTRNSTCSLKNFSIDCEDLVDVSSLSVYDLSSLEFLRFSGCSSLSDISSLRNLSVPSLVHFNIDSTQVSDISVLSTWKEFTPSELSFSGCPIEDVSSLSHIEFRAPKYNAVKIILHSTLVSDLSFTEAIATEGFSLDLHINMTPALSKFEEEGKEIPYRNGFVCFKL